MQVYMLDHVHQTYLQFRGPASLPPGMMPDSSLDSCQPIFSFCKVFVGTNILCDGQSPHNSPKAAEKTKTAALE